MKIAKLFLAAATIAASALPALAADLIHAGKWDYQIDMTMKGPRDFSNSMHQTQCIKPEDAKDPKKLMEENNKRNNCKVTKWDMSGNKASYAMECSTPQGKMTSTGETTYAGDSYETHMKMDMSGGEAGKMSIEYHIKAKRLGDCDQK